MAVMSKPLQSDLKNIKVKTAQRESIRLSETHNTHVVKGIGQRQKPQVLVSANSVHVLAH